MNKKNNDIHVMSNIGCICPPVSEQTCQNEDCPRKTKKHKVDEFNMPSNTNTSIKRLLQE